MFGQQLDSIKHIELISEVQDSMALISNSDINKINKIFHNYSTLDSLNSINLRIIDTLLLKETKLEQIIKEQKVIIQNEKKILQEVKQISDAKIEYYEKSLKQERNKKIG